MTRSDLRKDAEFCRAAGIPLTTDPNLVLALLDEALHVRNDDTDSRTDQARRKRLFATGNESTRKA